MKPKSMVRSLVYLLFLTSLNLAPIQPSVASTDTPTYTAITPSSGYASTWIKLVGENLSRSINGISRAAGYQSIYYAGYDGSTWTGWILLDSSTQVQDNNDGSVNVYITSGYQKYKFHIDWCANWSAPSGCLSLPSNLSEYTVTNIRITYDKNSSDATGLISEQTPIWNEKIRIKTATALVRTGYSFNGWNTAANGTGTSYSAQSILSATSDLTLYAQWLANDTPKIGIYMDEPFVQGSYASGTGVKTEDFNGFADGDYCANAVLEVGNVAADSVGCLKVLSGTYFSANSESDTASVGGSGSKFATNYPTFDFKIDFISRQKYVGFWWAAGSSGNQVDFLNGNSVVASMSVDRIFSTFGTLPADYDNSNDTITAMSGAAYKTKYYFGNPIGYTSLQPTVKSTVAEGEPYVYIHAFASAGSYFDGIRFRGSGFEIDNLAISSVTVPIRSKLIFSQGIQATNIDITTKQNTLTYNANGATAGSAPTEANSPFAQNEIVTVLSRPTGLIKDGYSFSGWNLQSDGNGVNYQAGDILTSTGDITLYAVWQPINYVAAFDSRGGSSVVNRTFQIGGSVDSPTVSSRVGYELLGWSDTSTSTSPINFPYSPGVLSNVTLYAIWSPRIFTVSFDSQGGTSTGFASTSWTFNTALSLPSAPTRNNFSFNGWFDQASGGTKVGDGGGSYSPSNSGNFTLYAQWGAQPLAGGGGTPAPTPEPVKQNPRITWAPTNMNVGDLVTFANPLNATFSVPGSAIYSISSGFRPQDGELTISVTFTPSDLSLYNVVSTSRTIQVLALIKPTPTPTTTLSPSPTSSPASSSSPAQSPITTPTPTATRSTSTLASPSSTSPRPRNSSTPTRSSEPKPVNLNQVKGSAVPKVDPKTGSISVIVSSFPIKTSPTSKLIAVATEEATGRQITGNFNSKAPGATVTLTGTEANTTYKVELLYISTTGQLKSLQTQTIKTPSIKPTISTPTPSAKSSAVISVTANKQSKVRVFIGKVNPAPKNTPKATTITGSKNPNSNKKIRVFIGKVEK